MKAIHTLLFADLAGFTSYTESHGGRSAGIH